MSKAFSPMGIHPVMQSMDGKVLKLLLTEHGLSEFGGNVDAAYENYLQNSQTDQWYRLCTKLYDIDLISHYHPNEGSRLLEQIHEAKLSEQFVSDFDLPGSPNIQSIIAWLSIRFKFLWDNLAQESYNNQIALGGKKFYLGQRIGNPPSDKAKKKMEDDFKKDFADYLTKVRSKVENVHVEKNFFPSQVRFIVYFDPFPKNQSEFENSKLTSKPNKAVEHLSILFKRNEKHPFITIKSEDLTVAQDEEIARLFITEFLGYTEGSKPTERYNLDPFNKLEKVELDRSDENLVDYRFTQLKIRMQHSDGSYEENTHKYSSGDVYDCCRPYYLAKGFPLERRKILELRMIVKVYVGPPPPRQTGLFGDKVPVVDRDTESYEVVVSTGSRTIKQCENDETKKSIERILDKWGLNDLNDLEEIAHAEN